MSARGVKSSINLLVTFLFGVAIGFSLCFAISSDRVREGLTALGIAQQLPLSGSDQADPTDQTDPADQPEPETPPVPVPAPAGPETEQATPEAQDPPEPTALDTPEEPQPDEDAPEPEEAEPVLLEIRESWPARHLFVTVRGTSLTPAERKLFADVRPGGVLLRADNCKTAGQTKSLISEIKQAVGLGADVADLPLIAVDQEGGIVNRLNLDDAPSAADLGKGASLEATHKAGARYAGAARDRGIGVLFAPVLDIYEPGAKAALDSRAFGSDYRLVTAMGLAFADGVMTGGALPVAKHYPGHGAVTESTDETLAVVRRPLPEVVPAVYPFAEAAVHQIPGIMVGHIAVPALERDGSIPPRPASLSPELIEACFRTEWDYEGVIITDNLKMGAITESHAIEEAFVLALAAGCDASILIEGDASRVRALCAAVDKALADGALTIEQLSRSKARLDRWQALLRKPGTLKRPLPALPADIAAPAKPPADPAPEPEPAEASSEPPATEPEGAVAPTEETAPETDVEESAAEPEPVPPPNTKAVTHEIKQGESLLRIAGKYQVSADDVVRWNGLKDKNDIKWGKELTIYVPE
ncbi:MAG: LysM peptidoglycan-binding domain-containing protein [bacterium]|nr:LysM peptidoglycan-binding domain-containing protein [bacterium]